MTFDGDNRDGTYQANLSEQTPANSNTDSFREDEPQKGQNIDGNFGEESYPVSSSCFSVSNNNELNVSSAVDDIVEKVKHDAEIRATQFHQKAAERAARVREQLDKIRKTEEFHNNFLDNPTTVVQDAEKVSYPTSDYSQKSVLRSEDHQTLVKDVVKPPSPRKQPMNFEKNELTSRREPLVMVQQEKTTTKTEVRPRPRMAILCSIDLWYLLQARVSAHSIEKIQTEKQKVTYDKENIVESNKPRRTIGQKVRDILLALFQ